MDFYRQKDIVFIPIQYIQKKRANYENLKMSYCHEPLFSSFTKSICYYL